MSSAPSMQTVPAWPSIRDGPFSDGSSEAPSDNESESNSDNGEELPPAPRITPRQKIAAVPIRSASSTPTLSRKNIVDNIVGKIGGHGEIFPRRPIDEHPLLRKQSLNAVQGSTTTKGLGQPATHAEQEAELARLLKQVQAREQYRDRAEKRPHAEPLSSLDSKGLTTSTPYYCKWEVEQELLKRYAPSQPRLIAEAVKQLRARNSVVELWKEKTHDPLDIGCIDLDDAQVSGWFGEHQIQSEDKRRRELRAQSWGRDLPIVREILGDDKMLSLCEPPSRYLAA